METIAVYIKNTTNGSYAVVQLDRKPVNAINARMVLELRETFEQLKDDPSIRGVILTGR